MTRFLCDQCNIECSAAGDGRERIVYVIDDDAGIRTALDHLFRSVGSSNLMRGL
jgi:hypothetical protein